jgi:hypothetical protein
MKAQCEITAYHGAYDSLRHLNQVRMNISGSLTTASGARACGVLQLAKQLTPALTA